LSTHNTTIQYFQPNSFLFSIQKLPDVTFTWKRVNIPAINFGTATQNTSMLDLPLIGEKLVFSSLEIKFIVDQKLINYISIDTWLRSIGPPEDAAKFGSDKIGSLDTSNYANAYSDAILHLLDSQNTAVAQIAFYDCYPILLSGFEQGSDNNGVQYVTASTVFKYSYYKII
jgi:hypothetical protein